LKFHGELVIGRFDHAPVSVHWSALLAFPFAWAATGSVLGGLVGFAAYVALMLVHELGHAVTARANGLRVISIQAFWLHGSCTYESARAGAADLAVAWGGVAAQFLLFLIALALAKSTVVITDEIPSLLQPLFFVWIPLNLLSIFYNLLPIPPLDGAKAWAVLPLMWRRATARKPAALPPRLRSAPDPADKVVSLDERRERRTKSP
jgi:stage IV sporulation protein FB